MNQLEQARLEATHRLGALYTQLGVLACALTELIDGLSNPVPRRHRATRAAFSFGPITNRFTGDIMATLLPSDSQVRVSVAYVDRHGNPATVDSIPAWDTDRPDLLSVAPDINGMSALVVAIGPTGPCQVSVTADAARGEPIRNIIGLLDLEVVAAEAVSATISAGDIEPQP